MTSHRLKLLFLSDQALEIFGNGDPSESRVLNLLHYPEPEHHSVAPGGPNRLMRTRRHQVISQKKKKIYKDNNGIY